MPTHAPVANLSSLNERPQAALRSTFNEGDLRHASDALPQPLRSAVQYNQNLQHVRHYSAGAQAFYSPNRPHRAAAAYYTDRVPSNVGLQQSNYSRVHDGNTVQVAGMLLVRNHQNQVMVASTNSNGSAFKDGNIRVILSSLAMLFCVGAHTVGVCAQDARLHRSLFFPPVYIGLRTITFGLRTAYYILRPRGSFLIRIARCSGGSAGGGCLGQYQWAQSWQRLSRRG
jgi:hypothetical protein